MSQGKTRNRNATAEKADRANIIRVQFSPADEYSELQTQLRDLAQEIVSGLSELELSQSKELLGDFVSELFLSIAKQDIRVYRREKQAEGIAAAKARGVRFGPSQKPLPEGFEEYYEAWQQGQISIRRAAEECGISRTAFSREIARRTQAERCSG